MDTLNEAEAWVVKTRTLLEGDLSYDDAVRLLNDGLALIDTLLDFHR